MTTPQMFLMFAMMHIACATKTDKDHRNSAFFWMAAALVVFLLGKGAEWVATNL